MDGLAKKEKIVMMQAVNMTKGWCSVNVVLYQNLTEIQRKAIDAACDVRENAYGPYSLYYVGAALVAADGRFFLGTNFENGAYGETLCAERIAVGSANTAGVRKYTAIAIVGGHNSFVPADAPSPCGSCRQVLYEASQLSGNDIEIILSTEAKNKIMITSIKELLPRAFGPLDLGIDLTKWRK